MAEQLSGLVERFARLGAPDPESWARSQAAEGSPQLHRFLFLRQMWELVAAEDDDSWIDGYVAAYRRHPAEPFAGAGRAIGRMLEKGVDRCDIVDLVRAMQAELLSGVCYRLEDPSYPDDLADEAEGIGWAVVTVDGDYAPTGTVLAGLHESVLQTDPTGRGMRPRPDRK